MPLIKSGKKQQEDDRKGQPSLFDNEVVWEEEKVVTSCEIPKKRKRRRTMFLAEDHNTYCPTNWAHYNQAQVHEKVRFQQLLFDLCCDLNDMPRIPGAGRNRIPFSDMMFAVVYKVFSCLSSRRFMSDLTDARFKGFLTHVPHFNSIQNYLELDEVYQSLQQLIKRTAEPLADLEINFSADSSGFSTGQFSNWRRQKYGEVEYASRAKWLKCHIMAGFSTNIISSVRITSQYVSDHGQFADLLEETANVFDLYHVCADKAYLSEKNLRLVHDRGGIPFIPFKPNNTLGGKNRDPVWKTMYHFFHLHRNRYMQYYGARKNVEATFSMIKRKFGERLRSKGESAQVNELLCKILCHNICCVIKAMYTLGIDADFRKHVR